MAPHHSRHPGSTPIVRIEGDTIFYKMWISQESGGYDMLVLRCDINGDVQASIEGDFDVCNGHTHLKHS